MDPNQVVPPRYIPTPPANLEELDVPETVVIDIMLRRLMLEGRSTLRSLTDSMKVAFPIIHALFQKLRQQQLFDVSGMIGNDYIFSLTTAGHTLAAERFKICEYAGPVPVSLKTYSQVVRAQAAKVRLGQEKLRGLFSDLVLTSSLLDELGPSVVSQTSLFLYGPTGNGKTCLAERVLRVYEEPIVIPYCVEVDRQIIMLYDPVVHDSVGIEPEGMDGRWVVCRRPSVAVGGELTPDMLELQLDDSSKIYAAPAQMKANNGVFIIDDFGRQVISATTLLNRWIVPLDRKVDYMSLRYGVKFAIPFEMMVVFATNLNPADLADEAFFRRIRNKVFVGPVAPDSFDTIFYRVATSRGLSFEEGSSEFLRSLCLRNGRTELRACYPRDMIDIVTSICEYEDRPVRITKHLLERAVAIYFTQSVTTFIERGRK